MYTDLVARAAGLLLLIAIPSCYAQRYFATALAGVSTLSADAGTRLGSSNEVSLYKPENGVALNLGVGIHFSDWVSAQANYVWNRNDLRFTEVHDLARLEQDRGSSQHAAIADLLVYFRGRRSRIRPYLSAGAGIVRLNSPSSAAVNGDLTPIPAGIDEVGAALRVAVGIDLLVRRGYGLRYSFSETISGNPLSSALEPPGSRNLANFQNLFGFVKYF